ncbi:MAG: zinc-ribbon domain-containing protein [Bacilli bacterium]|nr:zinc-ribbon domain-containing protein [Bacilli bacterium]
MYCGDCGKKLNSNSKFCPYCGSRVASENVTVVNSNEDSVNVLLVIASFLVPILGVVLFVIYKDKKTKTSKAYGIAALVGFISKMFFYVLYFIWIFLMILYG